MAGQVTGKDCNLWLVAHSGGATLANQITRLTSSTIGHTHAAFGVGDFTLTLDKGTVEQPLIGEVGNYMDQGSLSVDGSLTAAKFAASGVSDLLLNLVDAGSAGSWKYLTFSGSVSDATDATYLSWFLVSCQVTGYDITEGDADTITEASVDFTVMDPFAIAYSSPCIMDC